MTWSRCHPPCRRRPYPFQPLQALGQRLERFRGRHFHEALELRRQGGGQASGREARGTLHAGVVAVDGLVTPGDRGVDLVDGVRGVLAAPDRFRLLLGLDLVAARFQEMVQTPGGLDSPSGYCPALRWCLASNASTRSLWPPPMSSPSRKPTGGTAMGWRGEGPSACAAIGLTPSRARTPTAPRHHGNHACRRERRLRRPVIATLLPRPSTGPRPTAGAGWRDAPLRPAPTGRRSPRPARGRA